jgi:zinc transporter ZupT
VDAAGAGVVLAVAAGTALATGLGALPRLAASTRAGKRLGEANAVAAGVMLAAAAGLAVEGWRRGPGWMLVGGAVGALLVERASHLSHTWRLERLTGPAARKGLLIVGVMTAHSAAEGVGVGASFGSGDAFGLVVSAAIALHNVPEGLAIALVLVPAGTSVRAAAGWAIFSSLPQPLLALPAYAFAEEFRLVLTAGLGFAAGAMLWLAAAEILPDAAREASVRRVAAVTSAAFAVMLLLQLRATR